MPTSIQTAEPTTISRTHACAKKAPKLVTNKTFTFWRRRTSSHKLRNRVFTVGDRRVQAQKRASQRHEYLEAVQAAQGKIQELADGMRNRFGKHSAAHYYNDLIHRAHRSRNTRRVSPWNAYQKRELARMKSERGGDLNLTAVTKEISESWRRLSPEERQAITMEPIQQLEEQRESRKLAAHSVPLNSFHDARSTIQSIETQLAQLHSRTGIEYMLVACRSNTEDFVKPYAYYSSDLIQRFFDSSLKRSINDFALQLEAYVMSGVKGVVENSKTRTLELKKKTALLVLEKLNEITGTVHTRMTYDRFDDNITQKYGVVVKNWPLKNFCNPSSVGSRIELETLYNGWHSGVTKFEKLTEEEMMRWENERFTSHLAMMSAAPPEPTPEPAQFSPPHTLPPTLSAPPTPPDPNPPQPLTIGQHTTQGPAANHTLTPALPESPPLQQTLDPESIANLIRSDPSLQNIDPILLAAGAPQEHQFPVAVLTPASTLPANPLPPPSQLKRNRDAFQVVTPQSYGTPAKRLRKERGGKRSKKAPTVQGSESIVPSNAAT